MSLLTQKALATIERKETLTYARTAEMAKKEKLEIFLLPSLVWGLALREVKLPENRQEIRALVFEFIDRGVGDWQAMADLVNSLPNLEVLFFEQNYAMDENQEAIIAFFTATQVPLIIIDDYQTTAFGDRNFLHERLPQIFADGGRTLIVARLHDIIDPLPTTTCKQCLIRSETTDSCDNPEDMGHDMYDGYDWDSELPLPECNSERSGMARSYHIISDAQCRTVNIRDTTGMQ